MINNVQAHQEVVDHAEVRVEHPAEDRARDNGGKDPCDQKERANNAVTREGFTEEQGQRVTNKELQGKRGNCPDDGELHAIPEAWALHHRFIVRQARGVIVTRNEVCAVRVRDGQPDVIDQRDNKKNRYVNQCG